MSDAENDNDRDFFIYRDRKDTRGLVAALRRIAAREVGVSVQTIVTRAIEAYHGPREPEVAKIFADRETQQARRKTR